MSEDQYAASSQLGAERAGATAPMGQCAILMPSFNTGPELLARTVSEALEFGHPVWVVIDGSTDGSAEALAELNEPEERLRVMVLPKNVGKGAAIFHGLERAEIAGITHVVTMDADGQHPAQKINEMIEQARLHPIALILGEPVFDGSAPSVRVKGRRISNWWANVETLWWGIHDSLFGFRVYPVAPLLQIMRSTRWARRFDFDAETAVRLCWHGLPIVNVKVPVRYLRPDEGGVSQFRYLRDNVLLTWMHARLMIGFFLRLPWLAIRKFRQKH